MSDITSINPSVTRPSASQRAAYSSAGDVSRRASVMNERESPQNAASLNRLDRVLSSDQPLRDDVPRGFYLDLRV